MSDRGGRCTGTRKGDHRCVQVNREASPHATSVPSVGNIQAETLNFAEMLCRSDAPRGL